MSSKSDSKRYIYLRDYQNHNSYIFTLAMWWKDKSWLQKTAYLAPIYASIFTFSFFVGAIILGSVCVLTISLFWGFVENLGSDIKNSLKVAEELDQEFQEEFDLEKIESHQKIQNYKEWKNEKGFIVSKAEVDVEIKKQKINTEDKKIELELNESRAGDIINSIDNATNIMQQNNKVIADFNNKVGETSEEFALEIKVIKSDREKLIKKGAIRTDKHTEKMAKLKDLKSKYLGNNKNTSFLNHDQHQEEELAANTNEFSNSIR